MRSAPRALIAGLGLMGGSIGIALRTKGWHVAFLDPYVGLDDARRAGAADERVESLNVEADIIILATPVDVAITLLRTQDAGRRTFVTSICSVMQPLRAVADELHLHFVAGHPLAGFQERGLAAARGDLLRNAAWFVDQQEPLLARMILDCGARPERVTAMEHDAAVALTSHLPQVLSTALAAYLHDRRVDPRFAGSGLNTFLRLAQSDASVWSPVIETNRDSLSPHAEALLDVVRRIIEGDVTAFDRARAFMEQLKR